MSHVNLVLQEILDEVVRELHKVKDEIINGKQQPQSSVQYPERAKYVKPYTHYFHSFDNQDYFFSPHLMQPNENTGAKPFHSFLTAIRQEIGRIGTS